MLGEDLQVGENIENSAADTERDRKRALGIYYTPRRAAEILARWAIRSADDLVLEPSFGGCSMLSAAVAVFAAHGNHEPAQQLFGYDIDDVAFDYLDKMGIENNEGHFQHQDFLTSEASDLKVHAVLANPPFVSHQRLAPEQRKVAEQLRLKYLPTLNRKASLWVYFLLHAMSFLQSGGRMAFVLPNAIGTADYARVVMAFLESKFSKVELFHVAEQLFIQTGADERVSLLLLDGYTPQGLTQQVTAKCIDIRNIGELEIFQEQGQADSAPPGMHEIRASAAEGLALLCGTTFGVLGDIASVQIGEVVGDIKYFVRTQREWLNEGIDQEHLVPLLTRASQVPGLKTAGPEAEDRIPRLLRPPQDVKNEAITSYLGRYDEEKIKSNQTFAKRKAWFYCSYNSDADAFIGSMNHELARIVGNDAKISASNAFYKIRVYGQKDYAKWLPAISLTTPARLSAELLGRVRGSGGIKLEPKDVKRMIIPAKLPKLSADAFDKFQLQLDMLVRAGEIDSANHLADTCIFLRPRLLDAATLSKMRMARLNLTRYRLGHASSIA